MLLSWEPAGGCGCAPVFPEKSKRANFGTVHGMTRSFRPLMASPKRTRMGVGAESPGAGAAMMHARFLELDVREAHVEEKVNALETMKLLLTTGSAHEQRLRAALEQLAEQNRMDLILVKEECDARETETNDKLIRAELEIERLRSQVRCSKQTRKTSRQPKP